MSKAKELTKLQLEQLYKVYDFLLSLVDKEQNVPNGDEDSKVKMGKIAQGENLALSNETQKEHSEPA